MVVKQWISVQQGSGWSHQWWQQQWVTCSPEPSLRQTKQPLFPQPFLTRLVFQTPRQLHCPSLDMHQGLDVFQWGPRIEHGSWDAASPVLNTEGQSPLCFCWLRYLWCKSEYHWPSWTAGCTAGSCSAEYQVTPPDPLYNNLSFFSTPCYVLPNMKWVMNWKNI